MQAFHMYTIPTFTNDATAQNCYNKLEHISNQTDIANICLILSIFDPLWVNGHSISNALEFDPFHKQTNTWWVYQITMAQD